MTTITGVYPALATYFSPGNVPPIFKLPTKEEAKNVFFGLGEEYWKQMIDGKFHKYGKEVFDKGLHNPNKKEPGFLSSLQSGCQFAADHLTEDLSVDFYKSLHKTLCAHFEGEKNNVLTDNTGIGKFRDNDGVGTYFTLLLFDFINADDISADKKLEFERALTQGDHLTIAKLSEEVWDKCKEKCKKINASIMTFSNQFQIPTMAWISAWPDAGIKIEYRCTSSQDHERIVQYLFDDYKKKICELNSKLNGAFLESEINHLMSAKVGVIADLFQKLEWLHPFRDGQGRTDLVLQAKLLSEEGLNPAILEDPYFSTCSLHEEWKEYLIQGMQQWKKEKENH